MKIEKNKIVFGSILALVIIFIITYSTLVLGVDQDESLKLKNTLIPKLEHDQQEYKSKLDAINGLKQFRETNAPSIYDEKLLDSLGFYDRDFMDKEKKRIIDSLYSSSRLKYSQNSYRSATSNKPKKSEDDSFDSNLKEPISAKEIGLEHQLFFAASPLKNNTTYISNTNAVIYAEVDGNQVVKDNYRLRMRLTQAVTINNMSLPKNTLIYGFIRIQPNRVKIEIVNINHQPTKLKAFDFQDGSEGIYIENSFMAEATTEIIGDIVEDVNIAGVPQVSGVKKIFQRNNRNVKVTIANKYKLILKSEL